MTENAIATTGKTMRFGILASGTTLRAWQADVVRSLLEVPGVEPALLVVDARSRPAGDARARISRVIKSPNGLWDIYNNGWIGRRAISLRPVDMGDVLGSVPRLDVEVVRKGYSEYFPADAIEEIRSHHLDFLLRFAFGIIRGDILTATRYGVWSFHHDDEEAYRGSPPAFWELVDDVPVTGAVLQRLTDRLDGGQILHKGWFRSTRHSYLRNTDTVHLGAADWPARVCRSILAGNDAAAVGRASESSAPIYKKPDNRATAGFLVRQAGRFAKSQASGIFFADQWEIGLVDAPIHAFLDPNFRPKVEWLGLSDAPHVYAADPFVLPVAIDVDEEGPSLPAVLYERFDNASRSGEIWQASFDGKQTPQPAGLPISAHASYPFVFADGARTFCLPQVSSSSLTLYERLHGKWLEIATLLDHAVLDPTIVEWEGRWWLFGTLPGRDSLTKLNLWWSDAVEGPWQPHVLNPVKTDIRSARPAGTPFVHDRKLFRPAQDCSAGYGAAVSICEVIVVTPTEFEERVVRTLTVNPAWPYPHGVHTLSAAGEQTLIDARSRVMSRHETLAELRARIARTRRSAH